MVFSNKKYNSLFSSSQSRGLLIALFLLPVLSCLTFSQNTYISIADGYWGTTTSWSPNGTPGANDTVVIQHAIALDEPVEVFKVFIEPTGSLELTYQDFTVYDTIKNGGVVNDSNNTGTKIFNGLVINDTGATWNLTSDTTNSQLSFRGGIEQNNTTANSFVVSICNFSTNSQELSGIGDMVFQGDVYLKDGITIINNNTGVLYFFDVIDQAGGASTTWIAGLNSTIEYSRDSGIEPFANCNVDFSSNENTFIYNLIVNQNILGVEYWDLQILGNGTKTLIGDISVYGDLTIGSGLTFDVDEINNYNIAIYGDWVQGSSTFMQQAGTVSFLGATDQNYTCPGGESFYNLILNKSDGILILNDSIEVTNILSLTNDNINTNGNLVDVSNTSDVAITRTSGRIYGKLQRAISSSGSQDYLFPIGNSSLYKPVNLSITSLATDVSIAVEFIDTLSNNNFVPYTDVTSGEVDLSYLLTDGFWRFSSTSTPPIEYAVELDASGFIYDVIDIETRLSWRDNGNQSWRSNGNHGSLVENVISRTNLTDLNTTFFDLALASDCKVTQPEITGITEYCHYDTDSKVFRITNNGDSYEWAIKRGDIISDSNLDSVVVDLVAGYDTIIVTASNDFCSKSDTIIVYVWDTIPTPIAIIDRDTVCSGTLVTVDLESNVTGTTFSWEVVDGAGLGATVGSGSLIRQTLNNVTSNYDSVVYRVYTQGPPPLYCEGDSLDVTVWVDPTITISASNDTLFNGDATNINISTSNNALSGIRYTWTVTDLSGGSISGYSNSKENGHDIESNIVQTLTNNSKDSASIVYTVTPYTVIGDSNLNCSGNSIQVRVWVEPTISIFANKDTICNGGVSSIVVNTNSSSIYPIKYAWTYADNENVTGEANSTSEGQDIRTAFAQNLVNLSSEKQEVVYTITPYFVNQNGDSLWSGTAITTSIWVEPVVEISASALNDTIADGGTANITLSSQNITTKGIRYTWTVIDLSGGSITGFSNSTGNGNRINKGIIQTLINGGEETASVVYNITPYAIMGDSLLNCPGETFDVVVWVEPVKQCAIYGFVKAADSYMANLPVLLSKKVDDEFTVVSITNSDNNGKYKFDKLATGSYLVYAVPNIEEETQYQPSYFVQATHWEKAYELKLSGIILNADILLKPFIKQNAGNSTVQGTINADPKTNLEDSIYNSPWFDFQESDISAENRNITVFLKQDAAVVDWCLTDVEGDYRFDSVASGEYSIVTEYAGATSINKPVTVSGNKSYTIDAKLTKDFNLQKVESINIYPNPAGEMLFIDNPGEDEYVRVQIYSMAGSLIYNNDYCRGSVDISSIENGIYLVVLKTANCIEITKLYKK